MAEPVARQSVRVRLLIIALLPMLVLVPLLIGVTMQRWLWSSDQILAHRAAGDLTTAREYLAHLVDNTGQQLDALGRSVAFRDAQQAGGTDALLDQTRRQAGFDFLFLVDRNRPAPFSNPLLDAGHAARGIEILSPADIARLSPELAERSRIPLVPAGDGTEDRAMVILATQPVQPDGTMLVGGVLLNRNLGFVDRINGLVYPATDPASTRPPDNFDQGVTTLFLDDVRIATTLRPTNGERAIGTCASAEVRDRVLVEGQPWRDTAFVVNDWYFSAYDALTDSSGQRIGMLYTGFPKAPYAAARRVTWAIAGLSFLAVAALSVPLFLHWARGIFRPIEAATETIRQVGTGRMAARTGPQPGADELVQLALHLDRLLDQLQDRDRELRDLNQDLANRVEVRTAELRQANHALEAATRKLVTTAKLATIGEVTAGVAHEINNPVAVIQGNLEVLRMVMADRMGDASTEFALIEDQCRRIAALAAQLLQFSRPEEFGDSPTQTDPAQVIAGLGPLIRHLLPVGRITLETDLRSTGQVRMTTHELQQVLVNLCANAINAMPDGGTIFLGCEDAPGADGQPGLRLTLRDTGTGMDAATTSRIFDPFFTTRGTGGTGLGMTICQSLIHRQNGEIRVDSTPSVGTVFTIWLPEAGA